MRQIIRKIIAAAAAAAVMMPAAAFAATANGTQADPVQAKSSDTATIYIGKTLTVSQPDKFPLVEDFKFNIEAVKAWDNANVSASASGEVIQAKDMPKPSARNSAHQRVHTLDQTNTAVTVGSFSAAANTALADTSTEKYRVTPVQIRFTKAGYYMYRVSENASLLRDSDWGGNGERIPGMAYDGDSYYVVVYVCNKTDDHGNTIPGVYVHDITSYRNNSEGSNHQPDLSDIQNTPDNNGQRAAENNYSNYAKVGKSVNEPGPDPHTGLPQGPDKLEAFRFYNDQTTHDVVVTNNVTGNLGDITKEFEYIVTLTGLEKNKTYTTDTPAQDKPAGTGIRANVTSASSDILALTTSEAKGSVDTAAKSFTSDSGGRASFMIRLQDDEVMVFNALPATSKYSVRELASDHIASFTSESTENDTWVMALKDKSNSHSDLDIATAEETVDAVSNTEGRTHHASDDNDGTVTINFVNHRDLLTPTGLPYYGNAAYLMAAFALMGAVLLAVRRRNDPGAETVQDSGYDGLREEDQIS